MAVKDNVGIGKTVTQSPVTMSLSGSGNNRNGRFTALSANITGKAKATVTINGTVQGSGCYQFIRIGSVINTYGSGTYTMTGIIDGSGQVQAGGQASNDKWVAVNASATIVTIAES